MLQSLEVAFSEPRSRAAPGNHHVKYSVRCSKPGPIFDEGRGHCNDYLQKECR
jgi:hypothetical protein